MRTLVVARHPGPAGALVPVAARLGAEVLDLGWAGRYCELAGVRCTKVDDAEVGAADRAIAARRPDVVLTGTSDQVARDGAWWRAARELGIPSVALLDAWGGAQARFSEKYPLDHTPDYFFVIDDAARDAAIAAGWAADRVIITGQLAFDHLLAGELPMREPVRVRWGLSDEVTAVLFASVPPTPARAAQIVAAACAAVSGMQLIAKPHPREDMGVLEAALESYDAHFEPDLVTARALAGADVIFGTVTTLLVESFLAGLPTLAIYPEDAPEEGDVDGVLPPWIPVARTASEVQAWLAQPVNRRRLSDAERATRNAFAGILPGSTERVCAALSEVASALGRASAA